MKDYMKWHKYSTMVMMISALIGFCTGGAKTKKIRGWSILIAGLSAMVCIWSGHKMVGAKKLSDEELAEETAGAEAEE